MSQDCVAAIGSGVQIRASSIAGGGNGLWTARLFHRHDLITEYHGPLIDHKKALKLRKQNKHSHIRVLNSQFQYIDGIRQPQSGVGGASFANDARDSQKNNAIFVCKHDHKLGRDRVYLKATRDLPPGTEVFVGYGRDYWRNSKKAPASPPKQQASDSEQEQEESPQQPDQLHKRTRYGGRHQQQQQQQPTAQHNQQQPQPLQELRVQVNSSQNAAAIMQLRPQDPQQHQAAAQASRRCSPRLKKRHLQQHQQQVVAAAAGAWQAGQPGFNIQQDPVAAAAQAAALRMYLQQQQQQAAAGWPMAVGLCQGPYPLLSCSNLPMMSMMPFGCTYVQQPAAGYAGVPQLQQQPAQPLQQVPKRATRASDAAQAAAAAKAAAAAAMVEPWQVAEALAAPMLQQHKGQYNTRQGSFDSDEAADTTVAMDSCPEQQQEEDGEEEEDGVQQSPIAAAATGLDDGGNSDGRRRRKRSCVSIYRAVVVQDLSPGASTNPYKRVYRNRRAHT